MSVLNITKNNFQEEVMNSNKPVLLDFWVRMVRTLQDALPGSG